MEIINDYVKNICCYVILTTIIFNVFPDEKYVKYVKVFSGFILILIIVFPITNAIGKNFDFNEIVNNFALSAGSDDLEEDISEYEKIIEDRINEMVTGEN